MSIRLRAVIAGALIGGGFLELFLGVLWHPDAYLGIAIGSLALGSAFLISAARSVLREIAVIHNRSEERLRQLAAPPPRAPKDE